MSYRRVIPRDLFNEAKLLKCLGKLSVHVLDGRFHPVKVEDKLTDDNTFCIDQNESGDLYVINYEFKVITGVDYFLGFHTPLNSRSEYPLYCSNPDVQVLNEDGSLNEEFLAYLKALK